MHLKRFSLVSNFSSTKPQQRYHHFHMNLELLHSFWMICVWNWSLFLWQWWCSCCYWVKSLERSSYIELTQSELSEMPVLLVGPIWQRFTPTSAMFSSSVLTKLFSASTVKEVRRGLTDYSLPAMTTKGTHLLLRPRSSPSSRVLCALFFRQKRWSHIALSLTGQKIST